MFRVLVPSFYVRNLYPATNRYIVDMMFDASAIHSKPKCIEVNFSPWTFCPVLPDPVSVCVCVCALHIYWHWRIFPCHCCGLFRPDIYPGGWPCCREPVRVIILVIVLGRAFYMSIIADRIIQFCFAGRKYTITSSVSEVSKYTDFFCCKVVLY